MEELLCNFNVNSFRNYGACYVSSKIGSLVKSRASRTKIGEVG